MSDERPTGPMFGTMTEADFPNDTITLEMEPGYYTAKMRFAVINADEFAEIVEQRAALLEALQAAKDALANQRMFGIDTLARWKQAAVGVEGDIEEAIALAKGDAA